MTTIKSMFNFPPLHKTPDSKVEAIISHWHTSVKSNTKMLDPGTLFGVEVEVEGLENFPPLTPVNSLWSVTDDGSLRNYGREFISLPIRAKYMESALAILFEALSRYNYDFSPRCSVHVHMNARTLTPKQLKAFVLVYSVVEDLLFDFVGGVRYKNIHCVPLSRTHLLSHLHTNWEDPNNFVTIPWHKYTALNLCPIVGINKGTVEFRHMPGTDNVKHILDWINLISCLKLYVLKNSYEFITSEILSLNTKSYYREFVCSVFGSMVDVLDLNNLQEKMENNISLVKLNLYSGVFASEIYMTFTGEQARLQTKNPGTKTVKKLELTAASLSELLQAEDNPVGLTFTNIFTVPPVVPQGNPFLEEPNLPNTQPDEAW